MVGFVVSIKVLKEAYPKLCPFLRIAVRSHFMIVHGVHFVGVIT